VIKLDHFSFTYAGSERPILNDINLEFKEGEFVLIVGLSGCGKSTLCRAINGIIPHFYGGTVSGHVNVDGRDTRNTTPAQLANTVGMVFQDPENQLVMTNVENEMAFGLENLALSKKEMRERVSTYADYFELQPFFKRFIPELSGGEKQKVALASVIAMRPRYIVLDEPTSQLDEETATMFLEHLQKINKEQGVGVILVEHRLERCLHYAQRIIFMSEGRVEVDGTPQQVLDHLRKNNLLADFRRSSEEDGHGDVVISAKNISFAYDKSPVLIDLDLDVHHKEIVAIIGDNGSGKSTLLKQLNGILRPKQGEVTLMGRNISDATTASLAKDIGYLGQNPNNYLFEETLLKELEFTLKNLQVDKEEWPSRIDWTLKVLNLERYRNTFPRDLSCGERERAALASILVGKPRILVLDEPTRGLDHWNKAQLASILETLRGEGMTTIMVTHDYRFVAEHATRILGLRSGALRSVPMDELIGLVNASGGVLSCA
jgi:energy-coupling factor transport system ATP-binding protein